MGKPFSIAPYYFSRTKRVFDQTLALLLLLLLSPLFLIIAILISLISGFPAIFTQTRIGKNGKKFTMLKFRTMRRDAERIKHLYQSQNEAPKPMFKIHNDPRFVGIGKLLSSLGLDELPQLINILVGDMSFVGPRPLPAKEATALPKNWQTFREKVRPGAFSEWIISKDKHKNLKTWESLEKKTLKKGSIRNDLQLMVRFVKHQFTQLFRPQE